MRFSITIRDDDDGQMGLHFGDDAPSFMRRAMAEELGDTDDTPASRLFLVLVNTLADEVDMVNG